MFRTFIITTAAAITLTASTLAPTTASAKITTLGDCYNAVVTWCNAKHPNNASECAGGQGGGFDQCDEHFGKNKTGAAPFQIQMPTRPDRPQSRPSGKHEVKARKPGRSSSR